LKELSGSKVVSTTEPTTTTTTTTSTTTTLKPTTTVDADEANINRNKTHNLNVAATTLQPEKNRAKPDVTVDEQDFSKTKTGSDDQKSPIGTSLVVGLVCALVRK
jgi:hypothetical protein